MKLQELFEEVQEAEAFPTGKIYHAAPISAHDSITKNGIKPGKGGNTFMNRSYSKRVYFTTRIEAAWDFTMSVNARRGRDAIEYEIYTIDVNKLPKAQFYVDHLFDDYGIWADVKVPSTAIIDVTPVNHDWEPDDDYDNGR